MSKPVGLRAELIVNIALLVAAALLFVSFLLLHMTERALLEERLHRLQNIMEILAQQPALHTPAPIPVDTLQNLLPPETGIIFMLQTDRELKPYAPATTRSGADQNELRRVQSGKESSVTLRYASSLFPFGRDAENVAILTVPILDNQQLVSILQARFSLADIRLRSEAAERLVLIYIALYGTVLLLFGIYLLGRTIVVPIRRLRTASARVADGDLDHPVELKGPREILDLADSFNTMQEALRASREETLETIRSLEEANQTLQQTRDELVHAERMASVGHLAAGMAHEIGNPLGAIIGYLELLKRDLPSGPPRDLVERSAAEASRIDRLVRDLLDFATPVGSGAEPLDPVEAFAEARDLLVHQGLFEPFRLCDMLPSSLPRVRIDRHRLIQVLVNFLLNARDASPPGGEIRLAGGTQGEAIWLSVADQGEGIAAELLSHLFDPFFTTKAPGKGCGLGLSVCHRIATEAGGRIEVRSGAGTGAEFILWLNTVTDDEA